MARDWQAGATSGLKLSGQECPEQHRQKYVAPALQRRLGTLRLVEKRLNRFEQL